MPAQRFRRDQITEKIESDGSSGSPVVSVNGKTGYVTITKQDVGLGSADNTSDLNKPLSTATQIALTQEATARNNAIFQLENNKQDRLVAGDNIEINGNVISSTSGAGGVTSVASKTGDVTLVKADVGLSNVDNTTDLNKPISNATQAALTALTANKADRSLLDRQVVTDVQSATLPNGVGMRSTKTNLSTGATTTSESALPIASATVTGVMPKEAYRQIQDNTQAIQGLQGGGAVSYLVSFSSDTPDQAECQSKYEASSGKTGAAIEGTKLFDQARNVTAEWFSSSAQWVVFSGSSLPPTATNTTLGVVKGDASTNGKVFVETDGTMSLNGYDSILTAIDNKQDQLSAGDNITIAGGVISATDTNIVTSVSGKIGDVVLTKTDVGLSNADNTSDMSKPVSTAVQAAISAESSARQAADANLQNNKQDKLVAGDNISISGNTISATNTDIVTSVAGKIGDVLLNKSDVGLNNVDNTSDLDKPISTATSDAINSERDARIAADDTKLSIVGGTTTYAQVYAKNQDGAQAMLDAVDTSPASGSVVRRTTNGVVRTSIAVGANDAIAHGQIFGSGGGMMPELPNGDYSQGGTWKTLGAGYYYHGDASPLITGLPAPQTFMFVKVTNMANTSAKVVEIIPEFSPYFYIGFTDDGVAIMNWQRYFASANYTTTEAETGEQYNGLPVYTKIIPFGALPNSGDKDIQLGVPNFGRIIDIGGGAYSSDGNNHMAFSTLGSTDQIYVTTVGGNKVLRFRSTIDRSSYSGDAIIKYTKN